MDFEVIVHPAGLLDREGAGFWTEVVQLPACIAEGKTMEEAVQNTHQAIEQWLYRRSGQQAADTPNRAPEPFAIVVIQAL